MTKKIPVRPREQITVTLSDEQWGKLEAFIKKTGGQITEDLKLEVNGAISDYLTQHVSYRQAITPADFSKTFKRIAKLSHNLFVLVEDNFFPVDPENRYFVYNEIVRRRISRQNPKTEAPLIDEISGKKSNIKDSTEDRNEIIRSVMVHWVNRVSINYLSEDVDFEGILRCLHDLSVLFEKATKTLPSAKGEHGDFYLHELIARLLLAYQAAGGKGFTSNDAALPFIERLMHYVTELARSKIGEDHARELGHRTKGTQLVNVIKKAQGRKWLWD